MTFTIFTAVDDKPKMYDLQCMSYIGEDGKATDFRLKERILRNWRDFAYALRFPIHAVESTKPGEDPVEHLLRKWLQGANKNEDPRPITWGTLIAALRHANFQEEVNILEEHFIQVDTVSAQSGELNVCNMFRIWLMFSFRLMTQYHYFNNCYAYLLATILCHLLLHFKSLKYPDCSCAHFTTVFQILLYNVH